MLFVPERGPSEKIDGYHSRVIQKRLLKSAFFVLASFSLSTAVSATIHGHSLYVGRAPVYVAPNTSCVVGLLEAVLRYECLDRSTLLDKLVVGKQHRSGLRQPPIALNMSQPNTHGRCCLCTVPCVDLSLCATLQDQHTARVHDVAP